jgi:hypothetical protein
MSTSTGGAIYIQTYARSGAWNLIEDNTFNGTGFALENLEDGAAIYTETSSRNTLSQRNFVSNQHLAYQDNSGHPTKWISNVAVNCDRFITTGDGGANGLGVTEYTNNTGILTVDKYNVTERGAGAPIGIFNGVTGVAKNNVMVTRGDRGAAIPVFHMGNPITVFSESNNAAVGYLPDVYQGRPGMIPFTSPITGDLKITPDGIPMPDSPLLTQGADLGLRRDIRSYQGRKFIGAYGPARLVAE